MRSSITLTDLNTQSLFEHERLFQALTPEAVNNSLTAALISEIGGENFYIMMKDSLSMIKLKLSGTLSSGVTSKNFGIFFDFSQLMYILRNYTEQDLATLSIHAEYDDDKEKSSFLITCKEDKLALPHMVMSDSQLDEYITLDFKAPQSAVDGFSWSQVASDPSEFIEGLQASSCFFDTDEKKNNAIALYKNKMIANDSKHVFVFKFLTTTINPGSKEWLPIHKRIVKIISTLSSSGLLKDLDITESKAYLFTEEAACIMNNAVSNIAPPTEDDLKNISSEENVLTLSAADLKNTSTFFSGFYTNNTGMNPIKLTLNSDNLTFTLQDSGLADFGSCNIERKIAATPRTSGEYTIINDSLKMFLSRVNPDTPVDFYIEKDKPAVKLVTDRAEIYLARLK